MLEWFANLPPCLIGIDGGHQCGGGERADTGQCREPSRYAQSTRAGGLDARIVVANSLIELPKLRLEAQNELTRHRR